MPSFDLETFLPYQLAVLSNRLSEQFSQCYQQKFGITVPEWRVVAHLSQAEKVSVREIYQRVEMDKSKVSRAAARLVAAGYVRKDINAADRRLVELSLTKKGHAMVDEIGPMGLRFQEATLACFSDAEQRTFSQGLFQLSEHTK